MEKKIIAITSKLFPGVTSVFSNAQSLGLLKYTYLEDFKEDKADLWIFGAWQNGYQDLIDKLPGKKAILWTSSPWQTELSGEFPILNHIFALLKSKDVDYLFFGSKSLYECFKDIEGVYHFPYPCNLQLFKKYQNKKAGNHIGLFCPTHPRKALLPQLLSFSLASKSEDITLHTNVKIKIGGNVTYYDWLPKEDYYNLLSKLDLILNCFPAESFCYSTIEALMLGTLVVVSPTVRDNLNLPSEVCVNEIDSPIKISEKIVKLLNLDKEEYQKLLLKCKERADEVVMENNHKLKELLEKLI